MAVQKSFAQKQNEEQTRRIKAGQRLASDLIKNHLIPLGRWSDELYRKAFFTLIAVHIIDRLELLLTTAKQELMNGNLVHLDSPIVIMNETDINMIIENLNQIVVERDNIAAATYDFDQSMKDGLSRMVSLGYIPPVEYVVSEDEPAECKIVLPNLTSFTPPKL